MKETIKDVIGIIGVVAMVIGLLLAFSAAGASDANKDGWLWQAVTALPMMVIGLGITGWMLDNEEDE